MMTKEQSSVFFKHQSDDDLEELWEQRFFELKQFFLTRVPLEMLWLSKLKRFGKEYEAFLILTEQTEKATCFIAKSKTMTVEKKETVFPANFIEAFNTFHSLRNQFKAKVFQTEKILTLIVIIKEWLFMEEDYANYWATLKSKENEIEVFRSKETDPMELLSHLRIINEKLNIYNIEELKSQYNILPHEVKKEVKRLTLLANI